MRRQTPQLPVIDATFHRMKTGNRGRWPFIGHDSKAFKTAHLGKNTRKNRKLVATVPPLSDNHFGFGVEARWSAEPMMEPGSSGHTEVAAEQ